MEKKKSAIDKFLIKEDEFFRAAIIIITDIVFAIGIIYGIITILKYI
jgi:hypothetical protein